MSCFKDRLLRELNWSLARRMLLEDCLIWQRCYWIGWQLKPNLLRLLVDIHTHCYLMHKDKYIHLEQVASANWVWVKTLHTWKSARCQSTTLIMLIACGANYSVCYTELGLLFFWGIRNSDDKTSSHWFPIMMGISIPEKEYLADESILLDFHLTSLKASLREILACDSRGRVYTCLVNDSLTLKPYS